MSKPVIQALNNLIPRHSGTLPPELIELASSLLAQSRNKCSNLKQDEEIARAYACANLACERLKTTLNLPPSSPAHQYHPALGRSSTPTSTAHSPHQQLAIAQKPNPPHQKPHLPPQEPHLLPQTPNPYQVNKQNLFPNDSHPAKKSPSEASGKNRSEKKGLKYTSNTEKGERLPKWVGPVIRLLCRTMETPRAVPHLLAGVESVLCLPCPSDSNGRIEKGMEGKLPALIAALWFFVVVKMRGKEGQGLENLARKKMVRDVLVSAKEDGGVSERLGQEEAAWEGWEEVVEKDVNLWRKEIVMKGWREMDWFENIVEGCGVDGEAHSETDDGEDDDDSTSGEFEGEVRRVAMGSMINPKYTMTSARQKEYEEWKEMMLAKIEELIEDDIMDVDMDTTGHRKMG